MRGIKILSLKRLLWGIPFSVLLYILAGEVAFSSDFSYGPSRWTFRECLGVLFMPAAFIPDRFSQTRAGYIIIDELKVILPLHLLYSYVLLTIGAIVVSKGRRA